MSKLLSEEELDAEIGSILDPVFGDDEPPEYLRDNIKELIQSQKQAHADMVIGEDTATYHDHPFLSDYAMGQIRITVDDMLRHYRGHSFQKKDLVWFEEMINKAVEGQLQTKCNNSLRAKQRARNQVKRKEGDE